MSRIVWGSTGERRFELGVDRGVLYVSSVGVPWNGLTGVNEKSSGGTFTPYYFDGQRYLNSQSVEEFGATITAFTYPDEFMACDGTLEADNGLYVRHQPRKPFSFTYRTKIGNDVSGTNYAYKIHLVYNALASPSQVAYKTLSNNDSPSDFSWDVTLVPPAITGFRPSGHLVFDSRTAHSGALSDLENVLYGTVSTDPRMPDFDEIMAIILANANISVIDNGDGTYSITGDPDVLPLVGDMFTVDSPDVTLGTDTFTVTTP